MKEENEPRYMAKRKQTINITLKGNCCEAFRDALQHLSAKDYVRSRLNDFVNLDKQEQQTTISKYAVCVKREVGNDKDRTSIRVDIVGSLLDDLEGVAERMKGWNIGLLTKVIILADAYKRNPNLF